MVSPEDLPSVDRPAADRRPRGQRLLRGLAIGVAALLGLLLVAVGSLQVDAIGTAVARAVAARVAPPGLTVELERVSGSWLRSVHVTGIRVVGADGAVAARVDTLAVRWSLPSLLRRHIALGSIDASGAEVYLVQDPEAGVLLRGMDPPPTPAPDSSGGSGWTVSIDSAAIRRVEGAMGASSDSAPTLTWSEAGLRISSLQLDRELSLALDSAFAYLEIPTLPGSEALGRLELLASAHLEPGRLLLDTLIIRGRDSQLGGGGTASLPSPDGEPGPLDLDLVADGFPLAVIHGAMGRRPDPTARLDGTVRLTGTTRTPSALIDLSLRNDGGRLEGSGAARLGDGPVQLDADLAISSLDPSLILADTAWTGRLDGRVRAALAGPDLERLSGEMFVDLDAIEVSGLPLRSAALSSNWEEGTAALELSVDAEVGTVRLSGNARPLDSLPSYDIRGPVTVDLRMDSLPATTASGVLALEGVGVTPSTADAAAQLSLSSVAYGDARLDTAHVRAHFVDGVLDWRADARDPGEGSLRAVGRMVPESPIAVHVDSATVSNLALGGLFGDSIEGRVDARLQASTVVGAVERSQARFDIAVTEGRWAAIRIDTATAAGQLQEGRLTADLRLNSSAGRAEGTLSAHPFDDVMTIEIDHLAFADLDAGAVATHPDSAPTTRLTGQLEGRFSGTRPETATATFTVQLDSSQVNRQLVTGGRGRVELSDGQVDADFDLAFPDSGQLVVVARAHPFLERPEIEVVRLDFADVAPLELAGASPVAEARLTGRATATIRGIDPATLDADVRLDLDRSRLNDEEIPEGHVEATVRQGRVDADADLRLATGRFTAEVMADLATDTAQWSLDARLQTGAPGRLAGIDTLPGRVDATITAAGRGSTLAEMEGRFRAAADSTLVGDLQIDTLRFSGGIADGFALLDTLTLRSNVVDVSGAGRVALSDSVVGPPSDLAVEGELRSLTPLEPWVGIRPLGLGEGRFRAAVSGAPDALHFTATGAASALLIGTTELLGLTLDASGDLGSELALQSMAGEVQLDRLSVAGIDVEVSRLAGQWDGEEITIEGDATVDDRRDVVFSILADLREERPRADLDQFDVRVDDDRWSLVGAPSVAWGDGITFDSLALSADAQSLLLNGHFDLAGTSDLEVRVDGLRLGGLTDLLDLDRIDGTLSTDLTLEGSAADPHVRGEIDALLIRDGGAAQSRLRASLAYDTLLLDIDGAIDVDDGGTMEIMGFLPIDLALTPGAEGDSTRIATAAEGAVDLQIRADSFAVAWVEPFLDPAVVRGLSGHLEIDARVDGTQAAPTLSGRAGLRNGGLSLPALGVRYERARLEVALEGDRARIDSAQVHTDDGTLSLEGGVNLPELSLGEFDILGRLDRFQAIDNDAFRVRLSGTTELVGTTLEPRLEGDLQLVETDVYLDDAVASGAAVSPVELTDEQIRELEEYLGFGVTRPAQEPGALFDALALDVDVSASRDTWIRQRANPQMEIQVTGDATVTKEPGDSLRFDGRIETVANRSWVEQFGRRFTIQEGIVELRGTAAETEIDVQAVYEVSSTSDAEPEATITLDIDGTLDDLSLTLGSEPTMENADIVSYLATGRPASSTLDFQGDGEDGGGLGSIGSDFALGQVTGLVEGLAAEGVGLDVVEIRTDGLRGATLIAGRYVRPELYVGFKQPVGRDTDDPDADSGLAQTEVEVELQALRWLLLNMEAGNSAVSFLFRFRYAY